MRRHLHHNTIHLFDQPLELDVRLKRRLSLLTISMFLSSIIAIGGILQGLLAFHFLPDTTTLSTSSLLFSSSSYRHRHSRPLFMLWKYNDRVKRPAIRKSIANDPCNEPQSGYHSMTTLIGRIPYPSGPSETFSRITHDDVNIVRILGGKRGPFDPLREITQ
jgi:hypothetical protein